jgi:hypothetical protein
MSFKITWKTHIVYFGIDFIAIMALGTTSINILDSFAAQKFMIYPTRYFILNFCLYILLISIPIAAVHELLHGLAYIVFGGRVKFGFNGIFAYTQEISGMAIFRTKFLVVLLLPLTTISMMSLLIAGWLGGLIFLLNLIGSVGDLYIAFRLISLGFNSYIINRPYGFEVLYI